MTLELVGVQDILAEGGLRRAGYTALLVRQPRTAHHAPRLPSGFNALRFRGRLFGVMLAF